MEKQSLREDQIAERQRICPNCKTEFITDHLLRKFCNDECHNEYYNRIKRQERALEKSNREMQDLTSSTGKYFLHNQLILNEFRIAGTGLTVKLIDLFNLGFEFRAYTGVFPFDEENKHYYAQYGDYRMFWTKREEVLIKKIR